MDVSTLALAAGLMVAVATGGVARADDCVDTKQNNPAFASPYLAAARPCPEARSVPDDTKPARRQAKPASRTADATAKAVSDPDHATVTSKPGGGTLLKYGETTVCVSGSVTFDVATGSRRHVPGLGANPREPTCD